jgi:hypothetical protein
VLNIISGLGTGPNSGFPCDWLIERAGVNIGLTAARTTVGSRQRTAGDAELAIVWRLGMAAWTLHERPLIRRAVGSTVPDLQGGTASGATRGFGGGSFFRQPCSSQTLLISGQVFRSSIRPQYLPEIGNT